MVEYAGPPEPRGAVRVRLVSKHGWADLRGATTCAAITEAEARAVLARLGPDPLHNHPADRVRFVTGLLSRKTPIAALLMDQKVIAGVGNVYRAEVLFRQRLDPWLPGTGLSSGAAGLLWDDTAAVMADGVRDGRIITTPPVYWEPDNRESGHGSQGRLCPRAATPTLCTSVKGSPAGSVPSRWPLPKWWAASSTGARLPAVADQSQLAPKSAKQKSRAPRRGACSIWRGRRESNPHHQFGRLRLYH
ncbi:endonuclease 8 1 [Arthrobacter sp. Hiyo4]|nr:endonuclease 8 1 [Arthrobacter sp. Hiyo4]